MGEVKTTADDFDEVKDPAWSQAREILEACEIPPSFEVFEYGLEETRSRSRTPISVQQYANTLAENYRRIQ